MRCCSCWPARRFRVWCSRRGCRWPTWLSGRWRNEIARGTYKDIDIIVLSYALMLLYISCALSSGHWGAPGSSHSTRCTFPIHTKFMLGLSALLIVVCSLVVSVGVVSVLGLAVTPIISEVIPFLVLAIGIDNVFLLSQSFASVSRHALSSCSLDANVERGWYGHSAGCRE